MDHPAPSAKRDDLVRERHVPIAFIDGAGCYAELLVAFIDSGGDRGELLDRAPLRQSATSMARSLAPPHVHGRPHQVGQRLTLR
jgi:hypothetical protein